MGAAGKREVSACRPGHITAMAFCTAGHSIQAPNMRLN